MAGAAPDNDTYNYVAIYHDINSNQWNRLPPPGQSRGSLQIINSKLTVIVIGGWDNITNKITNKVTTYNNNIWSNEYPNSLKARDSPGVLTHLDYVIIAGGLLDGTYSGDIKLLNNKQSCQWMIAKMKYFVYQNLDIAAMS